MTSQKEQPHIVVIGGGTGTYTVLSALRSFGGPLRLSAVVAMADDGGSTGVLRDEMGVLPPGSVRPALIALSRVPDEMRAVFTHRFSEGKLAGHNLGNLILAALERAHNDFGSAVEAASRILNVDGEVIPSTLDNVRLHAELEDGSVLEGEAAIDVPRKPGRPRITRVWLEPQATLNPRVREVLVSADLIVIGPGDLYTSVIPNLIVEGMREALADSSAPMVYICNLMNKAGETAGFSASDFVGVISHHLPSALYGVITNTERPSDDRLVRYAKEGATPVEADVDHAIFAGKKVVGMNLLLDDTLVRHNPSALANAVTSFLP